MQKARFVPEKWDLTDALPASDGKTRAHFIAAVHSRMERFEELRGKLPSLTPSDFSSALALYEGVLEEVSRVASRAFMEYSANTSDQMAKSSLDSAEELDADVRNRSLFFRLWWTGLADSRARDLLPANQDYRYFLETWRKLRPHTLGEEVEKAVNLKNLTGFAGWSHHYDKVTSGFTFVVRVRGKPLKDEKGRLRRMMADEVSRLFASPDGDRREAAYTALLSKFAENGEVLGEVYRTIVRDWRNEYVKLRNYSSPIAPRNLENDVSDEVVDALLRVCGRNVKVFQDFFSMKAKLLGIRRMTRYHIYAPMKRKGRTVAYDDAVRDVMEAFRSFDPRVADLAAKVFELKHVDATPRLGKRSGAYCMSITPRVVPYIFLNFAGMTRDVSTIAHESGHAVHSQLASAHSVLTFQPPLVLAETASVFGEMILFDRTMRQEEDPEVKKSVLLDKISAMYGTIGRQSHFVTFENKAHAAVEEGATVEDLCGAYLDNLKSQFGSAVAVPDEFRWEWTYIPHIYHTPFYCYAYAFGNLLSLALYDSYLREGRDFVPKYLKILGYGGSKSPAKILLEAGYDMGSEKFWQGGFDVIGRMVGQLQKL